MRTTVVLAADVAAALQRRRRERGVRLSDEVNRLVRLALAAEAGKEVRRRYSTPVTRAGGLRVRSIDDIHGVLDFVDDPLRQAG